MAKKTKSTDSADVRFTQGDLSVLRQIASDWADEVLVMQPYPPEIASVLKKLGVKTGVQSLSRTRSRTDRARRNNEAERPEPGELPLRPNLG